MWLTKVRIMVTVLLLTGVVGLGGGSIAYSSLAAGPANATADREGAGDASRHLINIPSRVDGVLEVLGTEIKEGEKVPPGLLVTVKVDGEEKKYRALRVGDRVEEGQLLARVDDVLARGEVAIRKQKVAAAKADWEAAVKTRDEAEQRYKTIQKLYSTREKITVSLEEVRAAKLTWEHYFYDEISKKAAVATAELEEKKAQTQLEMYAIHSPVRGIITKIYRHRGEATRMYDSVVQILTASEQSE
jgi:multidrug efflux pump subunit AcrA (membrane-fusion protein)